MMKTTNAGANKDAITMSWGGGQQYNKISGIGGVGGPPPGGSLIAPFQRRVHHHHRGCILHNRNCCEKIQKWGGR